jgi:hypothetical protein
MTFPPRFWTSFTAIVATVGGFDMVRNTASLLYLAQLIYQMWPSNTTSEYRAVVFIR